MQNIQAMRCCYSLYLIFVVVTKNPLYFLPIGLDPIKTVCFSISNKWVKSKKEPNLVWEIIVQSRFTQQFQKLLRR